MRDGNRSAALLDLREIREGGTTLVRRIEGSQVGLLSEEIDLVRPLELALEVVRVGDALEIKGRVSGEAGETCSRCAAEFVRRFEERLHLVGRSASKDDAMATPDDDEFLTHDGRSIDLSDSIREVVLLSRPIAPICRDDCLGLCPRCGADLNQTACGCEQRPVDPRWQVIREHLERTKSGES